MRYANTNPYSYWYSDPKAYGDTYTYAYTNCHFYGDADPNRNTYFNACAHRNSDIDGDPNSNSYADSDPYCYTYTGYSLPAIDNDRSYQGSQHAVQFHGTSKRH